MLNNYLKILLRNFARNRAFTLINISGLTLGITCSLIMFLIVKEELSFNRYHTNLDSIYRVGHIDYVDGREYSQGGVPLPMSDAVAEEIVGVKQSTLISHAMYGLISVSNKGETKYYEESPEVVYIEPNFFDMFDWEVLEGEVKEALDQPNMVALSKTLAEKYFPDQSAIGKTIKLDKSKDLQIVAVLEDARKSSDFPFGIFVSMQTIKSGDRFTRWNSISSNDVMFVQLEESTTPQSIDKQFPDFIEKHWDKETRETRAFLLSPLSEYHFDDRFGTFSQRSGSKQLLWTYTIIGIFLIVTACFNFINMSTAMAVKRAKEVGMRKVLGSSRKQLVLRFLGETFAITFISVLVSTALTERLLPLVINDFFELSIEFNLISDLSILGYLLGILVVVSLLAGLYPALVLSGAKPVTALKGTLSNSGAKLSLRRSLVVVQFMLCQLLIFGTIVAVSQMNYFTSVDMGYDKEWILTFNMAEKDPETQKVWRDKIETIPGVNAYSISSHPPFSGSVMGTNAYYYDTDTSRTEVNIHFKRADTGYLDTYGLRMVAGEWFPKRDTMSHFVVNESFLKKVGIDPIDAIGETVNVWGRKRPITGVVQDFHAVRLDQAIEPMVIFSDYQNYRNIGLKINASRADDIIATLEETWYDIHEEYEFDYIFVDAEIEEYYETEKKMSQMLTVFAGISIFIGCLGLYGLVAFIANQKSKEIGIRKVLGASVKSLVASFSGEFAKLVGIAFLVAAPLGYFGMNTWLQEYEYGITIGPMIFIASIGASLVIAMLTTGYRSVKAATANPVNSLRDE